MTHLAEVKLWGNTIAAVSLAEHENIASFQYAEEFIHSEIAVSPISMPLSNQVYRFPELEYAAFQGLPGMLADSLPDKFGNAVIDQWLASQGRSAADFNAIERLCYTGDRGMGALEYLPITGPKRTVSRQLQVDQLVELASMILSERENLQTAFEAENSHQAMRDILQVGTSAGGARAKAVIAWHPKTNEVRSGQISTDPDFEYWIIKFDGVANNRDKELADPQGYGLIEFAYANMAKAAGIEMPACRLFTENNRHHFMVRRFDRKAGGEKIHMQTLAALAHFDFNQAGAYSYEQLFMVMRQLQLSMDEIEQQFRRMVFNVVARNHDDHVKNFAFLMDKSGKWTLAPAYDLTYSYNPDGIWTSSHQMSLNGKRDQFDLDDIKSVAKYASMKRGRARQIVKEVSEVIQDWPDFAREAVIEKTTLKKMMQNFRLGLDKKS